MKENLLQEELVTLAKECRLYARGKRQTHALYRVAKTLDSLMKSFEETALSIENPLTKREQEILELLALGYTNKEMASAFSISAKTIEYHLSSVLKKTESTKRTEALSNAIKFGWLSLH